MFNIKISSYLSTLSLLSLFLAYPTYIYASDVPQLTPSVPSAVQPETAPTPAPPAVQGMSPDMKKTELPGLSSTCFYYNNGNISLKDHEFLTSNFHAQMANGNISLTIGDITASDDQKKATPTDLQNINAFIAYLVLLAYNMDLPAACEKEGNPDISSIKDTLPNINWKNITLKKGDKTLNINIMHLDIVSTYPNINFKGDALGIKGGYENFTPSDFSFDIVTPYNLTSPYMINVKSIKTNLAGSIISGDGNITTNPDIMKTNGKIHLSITNISDLINTSSKYLPVKITTTLLIANIMGHHEQKNTTGWTIELSHGSILINGSKVPLISE